MKYCSNCKRLNIGSSLSFCQYCGRSFDYRICSRCHHQNPKSAIYCGACGSQELSEVSGGSGIWGVILKVILWMIMVLFLVSCLKNLETLFPIIFIIMLFSIIYSHLPEGIKKILGIIFNGIKMLVMGNKEKK